MNSFIRSFARSESGAVAAEYVVLLAILGGGIALGAFFYGTKVSQAMTARGNQFEACSKASSAC